MILTLHPTKGGTTTALELPDGTMSKGFKLPMFGGARWLLAEGHCRPGDLLEFKRPGRDQIDARASARWLAQWSISEPEKGAIKRVPYSPMPDRSTLNA